ncbi:type II secretion system protein [Lacipirellula parvula]|uniref:Type II secretion system protein GspG C-terminal domain-containing protein n=1 Tax=Lacipirellula parvula TaxID=2650471 RepID=A0A5K7XCS4_9BACT|nr:prepilin-type N-terminal cleavage/methylation domain-containing protein [Lacipirellula parvula]BBO32186.1 hypothetical protein PLANPX_1798 [Lacipirellula parvula]
MQESQVTAAATSQRRATARRKGFTLTELLVVIAIIAVLAGLIAAAAVNALKNAKRARIVLEVKNLSGAAENFKNDYGIYPPNGMNPSGGTVGPMVRADFVRAFKKAFPRHNEPADLIDALAGVTPSSTTIVTSGALPNGMTGAEALYFWLGGFSSDEQYPISGPGGPSFSTATGSPGEVLENRNKRYEFDLGRLTPRNDDGSFLDDTSNAAAGRFVTYVDPQNSAITRRINLWRYIPAGSTQPLVYFDTSRHKPYQYDPYASATANNVFALKKVREGKATAASLQDLAFVDAKFQILHCGLDDDWGDFGVSASGNSPVPTVAQLEPYLFPKGVYIGPIADTLTNFTEGELSAAAEQ